MLTCFADGTPAVQAVQVGKGKLYLFGFSLGYSYYAEPSKSLMCFMEKALKESGAKKYPYANFAEGIYEKRLQKDGVETVFLFNNRETDKQFDLGKAALTFGGDGEVNGNTFTVAAHGMAYAVLKK